MRSCKGRVFGAILLILLLNAFSLKALSSEAPYQSYIYDFFGTPVSAPQAYLPDRVIDGDDLGSGSLKEPRDLFVAADGQVYVLDSGNARVLRLNSEYRLLDIIEGFDNEGQVDTLSNPQGIFVTDTGDIYIADTDNGRVVVLDKAGNLKRILGAPRTELEGIVTQGKYRPVKVVVDPAERVFVLAEHVFDGILEFDVTGKFNGFFGAPRVKVNPLKYFWTRIATPEQRSKMSLFLPTEFSGIDVDEIGLLYGTVLGDTEAEQTIRRLNTAGIDILRRDGVCPPVGDSGPRFRQEPSRLIDIAARGVGMYSVLDKTRGRIFTYDENGNLLYVFGGLGDQKGTFRSPVAIDSLGDELLVLDRGLNRFTTFKPTVYAQHIHSAIEHYNSGEYDLSMEEWSNVLRINANYDLAYTGMATALLRQGEYARAMEHYYLGQNRKGYSKAFQEQRKLTMKRHFGFIVLGMIPLALLIYAARYYRWFARLRAKYTFRLYRHSDRLARRTHDEDVVAKENESALTLLIKRLTYSLHVIFHPFDGFWDIKHEQRGSVSAATIILTLAIFSYIFARQYIGFIFSLWDVTKVNLVGEAISILIPFFLWCIVNWAFTTLTDGKGTFRDIYIATAYALTPLVLLNIPSTLLSHFLVLEEGTFYYLLIAIATIWSGLLVFIGMMVTHEYDLLKGLLTSVITVVGMGAGMFIGLLFANVIELMVNFGFTIYTEILFRI